MINKTTLLATLADKKVNPDLESQQGVIDLRRISRLRRQDRPTQLSSCLATHASSLGVWGLTFEIL